MLTPAPALKQNVQLKADSCAPTFALFLSLGFVTMSSLTFSASELTLHLGPVPAYPFPPTACTQSDKLSVLLWALPMIVSYPPCWPEIQPQCAFL